MSLDAELKILIVDDEPLARIRLLDLLAQIKFDLPHTVIASVPNVEKAARVLEANEVDIVLLDINMPVKTGLAWIREWAEPSQKGIRLPQVILVTADPQYALEAFDLDVADYLLKPVNETRLLRACIRAHERIKGPSTSQVEPKLIIKERGHTFFLDSASILFCRADLKYTTVYTKDRAWLTDYTLHELESTYPRTFLRIHRSTLVAKDVIESLIHANDAGDGQWKLRIIGSDEPLVIARRHLPQVREILQT